MSVEHPNTLRLANQEWQQSLLDWVILFLCPLSIGIDIINGYFMLAGSSQPISVAFKSMLLVLLFARLAITSVALMSLLLTLLLFHLIPIFKLFLLKGDFSLFFLDFSFSLRVIFFLSFMIYILTSKPDIHHINLILKVLVFSLLLNLLLGFIGLGFPTYSADEGFGIKGFIFSGNELAVTLIALSYYVLFKWVPSKSWAIKMLSVIIVIAAGVLVATKSAMLGTLIIAGVFMVVHARRSFWACALIVSLVGLIYIQDIYAFIKASGFIDRFIFVYNKRGLWSLILSSREDFFLTNLDFVMTNFGLAGWLFGWSQGAFSGFVKTAVEIDIIDLFFYFGIAGLVCYILFFSLLFKLIHGTGSVKVHGILVWLLLLFVSVFAGHLVYSGVAAIPLTLALYAVGSKSESV